ncbi:MAG: GDP-mannose 4,6-dehydratase, partial [Chitinophagaceae bacterium]|nr:GDP-mannose 4,6-dehydratase [Chitinophagaceae bacterium]
TGITTSVRDFVILCFRHAGIELRFEGVGIEERGYVERCSNPEYQLEKGKQVVGIHPRYFRPAEVDLLIGDATKAKLKLGWEPKYDLDMLVNEMMKEEIIFQAKKK